MIGRPQDRARQYRQGPPRTLEELLDETRTTMRSTSGIRDLARSMTSELEASLDVGPRAQAPSEEGLAEELERLREEERLMVVFTDPGDSGAEWIEGDIESMLWGILVHTRNPDQLKAERERTLALPVSDDAGEPEDDTGELADDSGPAPEDEKDSGSVEVTDYMATEARNGYLLLARPGPGGWTIERVEPSMLRAMRAIG